jgi:hypothetical protein
LGVSFRVIIWVLCLRGFARGAGGVLCVCSSGWVVTGRDDWGMRLLMIVEVQVMICCVLSDVQMLVFD